MKKRTDRLNSLLQEVISEVIRKDVRNPDVHPFVSVTHVDISKDLHHAKVYFSVIGTDNEKQLTLEALTSAASFIAINASKKVVMRHFPALTFHLDTSVDKHLRIDAMIEEIHDEQKSRRSSS